ALSARSLPGGARQGHREYRRSRLCRWRLCRRRRLPGPRGFAPRRGPRPPLLYRARAVAARCGRAAQQAAGRFRLCHLCRYRAGVLMPLASPKLLLVAALLVGSAAVPVALVAQDMNNEEQKDWLTSFVEGQLSTPERQIRLSNIDGILGSDVSIRQITISDAEGVWLRVNNASLNWNQAALFTGRLDVRSLRAESIDYVRNAIPVEGAVDLPPPEAGSLEIPEFPVAIQLGELAVPSVTFGEGVFGLASEISLAGSMTLEGGNLDAVLDIERLDGPGGTLDLDVSYRRETNAIDLGLSLVEPPNGVIANLLNIE